MPPKIKRGVKTKPVLPPDTTLEALHADIDRLSELMDVADEASAEVTAQKAKVHKSMDDLGLPAVTTGNGNKAQVVQAHTRTINEEKLKRKVGPGIWRRCVTLQFDRKKAEALVSEGVIDPVDYADCITETPNNPYVKATKRK